MENKIVRFDMHTHSQNSHDSVCPVAEMAKAAKENALSGFAVTDHCDIEDCEKLDLSAICRGSFDEATKVGEKSDLIILRGIEIGEAFWHGSTADMILSSFDFDVVIGSVHAVKFKNYEMPYSQINFQQMGREMSCAYLEQYFTDMLKMIDECDFDILAHLTCPLRYINGKYGIGIDCKMYKAQITEILQKIIDKGIALEVNSSCVYEGSGYCEFLPEEWIIELYKSMGGYLITTGSDAHVSKNSALSFDKLYDMLKKIGFEKAYYFQKRKAREYKL